MTFGILTCVPQNHSPIYSALCMATNVFMFDLFKSESGLCRERKGFHFLQGRLESRIGGFHKV